MTVQVIDQTCKIKFKKTEQMQSVKTPIAGKKIIYKMSGDNESASKRKFRTVAKLIPIKKTTLL